MKFEIDHALASDILESARVADNEDLMPYRRQYHLFLLALASAFPALRSVYKRLILRITLYYPQFYDGEKDAEPKF